MHMADALISPAVGGTMWAAAAGLATYSVKRVQRDMDEKKIPLMGVMGAFVFAAQMINFSIPGTGSSGHLGGGILLAIILGPYAGFLTMASILFIQALFFADGGLLAFGCNVFNLGFYPCFIAYPLIYRYIVKKGLTSGRIIGAAILSSVVGLQMGAFSVVLQTLLSGKTELPFSTFLLMMQPIHLAIGIVEGLATAAIVSFVWKAKPDIIEKVVLEESLGNTSIKKVAIILSVAVIFVGGVFSWFASAEPDGLEWAISKTAGKEELEVPDGIHKILSDIQEKTALLPDYDFRANESEDKEDIESAQDDKTSSVVNAGTSVSGLVGGSLTLLFAALIGLVIHMVKRKKKRAIA